MSDFSGRNIKKIVLFDVDGTLTEPRAEATSEMKKFLSELRTKVEVGIIGGSDLVKQKEQMGEDIIERVDYSFSENGLVAYKDGVLIGKQVIFILIVTMICSLQSFEQSINSYLGEENIKRIINFALKYISELDIPIKR
jgi:phosphomannomutase